MEHISILPEDLDLNSQHRYLRLPHPRTGQPQLYLPVVSQGKEVILEVSRLNGSRRRTWFIGDSTIDSGTILLHHPVDPLFLVIPLILSLSTSSTQSFQPLSALISTVSSSSDFSLPEPFTAPKSQAVWNADTARLLELKSVKRVFKLCCERKIIPSIDSSSSSSAKGQAYYRPSIDAILKLLRVKIEWFAEESRWGCFDHNVRGLGRDGLLGRDSEDELVRAMRIKTTIDHYAQYLPAKIFSAVQDTYQFTVLNDHLANMSAAALVASMPPTNLPGKQDKSATGAGAKRKALPASRGVEALKKVNTTSMSKLTSFFKPKDK